MANISALAASKRNAVIPLTNLGRTGPAVSTALREISRDYARAGRKTEARTFIKKAFKVASDRIGSP